MAKTSTSSKSKIQDALDWIIPILKTQGIKFHITGGFAAHLYGATREINDIDIDIPFEAFPILMPSIQKHVIQDLIRYKDSHWDIFLVTLDYQGQIIDLSGDREAFIFNHRSQTRDPLKMNFDSVILMNAYNHLLPVQNPHDLIEYKEKIVYEEAKHKEDASAVKQYLKRNQS
jgi:hypothetical protein